MLDNAVKYTNERGRIDVTLGKKKNRIYLSVFNTTEYISKEQTSRLFDRFYRTDISRNSQTGGYGLGLSIAAATADSHKGKIMAETEDEKSLRDFSGAMMNKQYMRSVKEISVLIISNMQKAVNLRLIT